LKIFLSLKHFHYLLKRYLLELKHLLEVLQRWLQRCLQRCLQLLLMQGLHRIDLRAEFEEPDSPSNQTTPRVSEPAQHASDRFNQESSTGIEGQLTSESTSAH
jgi:hypothetical protein